MIEKEKLTGRDVICMLDTELDILLESTHWNPTGVSGDTTVRFVEVKAMLINAKKKLHKIAKGEGYAL